MGDLSLPLTFYTILFFAFPLVFGYLMIRLGIPLIVGYIMSGIALGIIMHSGISTILSTFANVGLLFLFFSIGLEVNLKNLKNFSKFVFIGGGMQIIFTALLSLIFLLLFKFSLPSAMLISAAFAFSSTAVVSKLIQDKSEETSMLGQITMGVLIFQDLVAIPLIVAISSYQSGISGVAYISNIIFVLFKVSILLALVYFIGEKITPIVFSKIGKLSRELLNLFTILFIFTAVFFFSFFGISATLAAFIAGLLVGQTLEHYHVFSQIRPLRDLFVILFFVFLGASISITEHLVLIPKVLLFTLIFLCIKFIIIFIIFIRLRFNSRSAHAIALYLTQVGEFAFVLIHQAKLVGFITLDDYAFALMVTVLSLAITPAIVTHREILYRSMRKTLKRLLPFIDSYLTFSNDREAFQKEGLNLKNHIILCGFGTVGSYIGRALLFVNIPYIAVDYNVTVVEEARNKGLNIIYGDPCDMDVLQYIGVKQALCLIAAVPNSYSQETIIVKAKSLNPNIIVFTRVEKEVDQKRLKSMGAEVVIDPKFEAAVSIIKKILLSYKVNKDEIVGKIKRLKLEHGML